MSLLRERCTEANIQPTRTHDNHPASNIRQQDDYTGRRPFIHLDMANIHGLLQIGYTRQEIADLAGVSTKTLQHRLAVELAMTLNEDEIDEAMRWLVAQFPSAGQRLLQGAFRANGQPVTRRAVRLSLMHVDPIGTLERTAIRITRRQARYWVPYPMQSGTLMDMKSLSGKISFRLKKANMFNWEANLYSCSGGEYIYMVRLMDTPS